MNTNDIEIYTLPTCPFCIKAKKLLCEQHLDYNEYDISHDEENLRKSLAEKYGISSPATVPQITINGKYVGGYSDLKELVNTDKLKDYIKHE